MYVRLCMGHEFTPTPKQPEDPREKYPSPVSSEELMARLHDLGISVPEKIRKGELGETFFDEWTTLQGRIKEIDTERDMLMFRKGKRTEKIRKAIEDSSNGLDALQKRSTQLQDLMEKGIFTESQKERSFDNILDRALDRELDRKKRKQNDGKTE